jgi:hypothetical protein
MMVLKILSFSLLFILINKGDLYCQIVGGKLECLQGVWEQRQYDPKVHSFKIIKNNKSLSFGFDERISTSTFPLEVYFIGFQSKYFDQLDSLELNSLSNDGQHYTEVPESSANSQKKFVENFYIPLRFGCEDGELSILGAKLSEYNKIKYLRLSIIKLLNTRGIQDKKNYINEFSPIIRVRVNIPKSIIFSSIGVPTKSYFVKDNLVEFLEIKGEWIHVRYYGKKLINGWIKSRDVE